MTAMRNGDLVSEGVITRDAAEAAVGPAARAVRRVVARRRILIAAAAAEVGDAETAMDAKPGRLSEGVRCLEEC